MKRLHLHADVFLLLSGIYYKLDNKIKCNMKLIEIKRKLPRLYYNNKVI